MRLLGAACRLVGDGMLLQLAVGFCRAGTLAAAAENCTLGTPASGPSLLQRGSGQQRVVFTEVAAGKQDTADSEISAATHKQGGASLDGSAVARERDGIMVLPTGCACTGRLNEYRCTDGTASYCASHESCDSGPPSSCRVECACTGHLNQYQCTDGTAAFCVSDEACYATEPFAKGSWGDGCRIECACTGHLNRYQCTDNTAAYCAADEACYATEPFAKGSWGDGCRVECTCTGHLNQYQCTDGTAAFCASDEVCYANEPFAKGNWADGCRAQPSGGCAQQVPVAASLTATLERATWTYSLSIDLHEGRASMDCLAIFPDADPTSLLGVFHSGVGGHGHHNALYLARAAVDQPGGVPGTGDWHALRKLSPTASMGYLKRMPGGDQVFLAYEWEDSSGNRIAIRLYEDRAALLQDRWLREVRLSRSIVGADGRRLLAGNVGTPSIASIRSTSDGRHRLELHFHYYTHSDVPGVGSVDFPAAGSGIVSTNYGWDARFAPDVDNAMRAAQAQGKIGQRAHFDAPAGSPVGGAALMLYEAQMADAGESFYGWLSWRAFVYQSGCRGQPAAQLALTLPTSLQTFANPHVTVVGEWMYVGFFIPSEPFNPQYAAAYATADRQPNVRCSSCASNPMQQARAPAGAGSFLASVRVSDVFGGPS